MKYSKVACAFTVCCLWLNSCNKHLALQGWWRRWLWAVPGQRESQVHSSPSRDPCKGRSVSFFFFCLPNCVSRSHHFGRDCCKCDLFFNPTIEVVTFRLRGWCMLGVFLLTAFTCLGHECQNLLSPCNGIHVCTDWTSVHALIWKSFGGMEPETMLTPQKKSPLPEAQRRFELATLHHARQGA